MNVTAEDIVLAIEDWLSARMGGVMNKQQGEKQKVMRLLDQWVEGRIKDVMVDMKPWRSDLDE